MSDRFQTPALAGYFYQRWICCERLTGHDDVLETVRRVRLGGRSVCRRRPVLGGAFAAAARQGRAARRRRGPHDAADGR